MSDLIAEPTFEPPADALAFYEESLRLLKESGIPFLLSGAYAVTAYTGIRRPTKGRAWPRPSRRTGGEDRQGSAGL